MNVYQSQGDKIMLVLFGFVLVTICVVSLLMGLGVLK